MEILQNISFSHLVFLVCCHCLAYSSSSVFLAWEAVGWLKAEWGEERKEERGKEDRLVGEDWMLLYISGVRFSVFYLPYLCLSCMFKLPLISFFPRAVWAKLLDPKLPLLLVLLDMEHGLVWR